MTNFQLLIQSLNLSKPNFLMSTGGGRVCDQLPTFDPESKSGKNQISLCPLGGEGSVTNFQLLILSVNLLKTKFFYVCKRFYDQIPTFDPESKSAKTKFPYVHWEGRSVTKFQLLILSLNLL